MISHACTCGAPAYEGVSAQFLHNTTLTHSLSVLKDTGAPSVLVTEKKRKAWTCLDCGQDVVSRGFNGDLVHCTKGNGHKV